MAIWQATLKPKVIFGGVDLSYGRPGHWGRMYQSLSEVVDREMVLCLLNLCVDEQRFAAN